MPSYQRPDSGTDRQVEYCPHGERHADAPEELHDCDEAAPAPCQGLDFLPPIPRKLSVSAYQLAIALTGTSFCYLGDDVRDPCDYEAQDTEKNRGSHRGFNMRLTADKTGPNETKLTPSDG